MFVHRHACVCVCMKYSIHCMSVGYMHTDSYPQHAHCILMPTCTMVSSGCKAADENANVALYCQKEKKQRNKETDIQMTSRQINPYAHSKNKSFFFV